MELENIVANTVYIKAREGEKWQQWCGVNLTTLACMRATAHIRH